jgi:hypothetical protein
MKHLHRINWQCSSVQRPGRSPYWWCANNIKSELCSRIKGWDLVCLHIDQSTDVPSLFLSFDPNTEDDVVNDDLPSWGRCPPLSLKLAIIYFNLCPYFEDVDSESIFSGGNCLSAYRRSTDTYRHIFCCHPPTVVKYISRFLPHWQQTDRFASQNDHFTTTKLGAWRGPVINAEDFRAFSQYREEYIVVVTHKHFTAASFNISPNFF